jgi:hypothetical protein
MELPPGAERRPTETGSHDVSSGKDDAGGGAEIALVDNGTTLFTSLMGSPASLDKYAAMRKRKLT